MKNAIQTRILDIVDEALENINEYDEYYLNKNIEEIMEIAQEFGDEDDRYWALYDLATALGSHLDDLKDIASDNMTAREDKFGAVTRADRELREVIDECIEALA